MNSWTIFDAATIGKRAVLGERVMQHRTQAWQRYQDAVQRVGARTTPETLRRSRIYATRTRVYERMLSYR